MAVTEDAFTYDSEGDGLVSHVESDSGSYAMVENDIAQKGPDVGPAAPSNAPPSNPQTEDPEITGGEPKTTSCDCFPPRLLYSVAASSGGGSCAAFVGHGATTCGFYAAAAASIGHGATTCGFCATAASRC